MKFTKIISIFVLTLGLALPATRASAGIPVVDAIGNVQLGVDYVESLYNSVVSDLNMAENITTALATADELKRAWDQYNDYMEMYRNISSVISDADIKQILPTAMLGVDISPLLEGGLDLKSFDSNVDYSSAAKDIGQIYQRLDNDWATNKAELTKLLAGVKNKTTVDEILEEAERNYVRAQLATSQKHDVNLNNDELADSVIAYATLEGKRAQVATAPKNQLQVLKLMATQNQAILQNLIKNNQIANQQFSYSNQSESDRFARLAKSAETSRKITKAEAARLAAAKWDVGASQW